MANMMERMTVMMMKIVGGLVFRRCFDLMQFDEIYVQRYDSSYFYRKVFLSFGNRVRVQKLFDLKNLIIVEE